MQGARRCNRLHSPRPYDMTPNGTLLGMNTAAGAATGVTDDMPVLNWFEEPEGWRVKDTDIDRGFRRTRNR